VSVAAVEVLLFGLCAIVFVRDLATGRMSWVRDRVRRRDHPVRYWGMMAVVAVMLALMGLMTVSGLGWMRGPDDGM
jgi:hypothetical protein